MSKAQKEISIQNPQGLHARPAALFVQIASKYDATINLIKDQEKVSGKSIMGILTLGANQNSKIIIQVEGENAEKILQELEALLTSPEMIWKKLF